MSLLGVECYICHKKGHISINCTNFDTIRGNLRQAWLKKMKEHATAKDQQRSKSEKKLKKDFSLDEYVEDEDDEDRKSVVDMFQFLEKRYKQDELKDVKKAGAVVEDEKQQEQSSELTPTSQ